MDLTTWLEAEKGRSAALAEHFDRTPSAVSQWKRFGVPVDLMKAVRDFTGGAVTLEEMVPESAQLPDPAIKKPEGEHAAACDADTATRHALAQREADRILFGTAAPPATDKPSNHREGR